MSGRDETWRSFLPVLTEFQATNGRPPSRSERGRNGERVGEWLRSQRRAAIVGVPVLEYIRDADASAGEYRAGVRGGPALDITLSARELEAKLNVLASRKRAHLNIP